MAGAPARSRPNNLPAELTSFVGRRSELREVKRLLSQTRLLTLTGSGGAGKTRLALRAAGDLLAVNLLKSCPQLPVLTTSRQGLGVPGETRMRVPPLSLPEEGASLTPQRIATSEAVTLLSERAAAVLPGFGVHRRLRRERGRSCVLRERSAPRPRRDVPARGLSLQSSTGRSTSPSPDRRRPASERRPGRSRALRRPNGTQRWRRCRRSR
jgi:hypothetical protein